jgi:adenine phosphoribosyltransferase
LDQQVIHSDRTLDQASKDHLRSLIRDVPNFPKDGILFKDITPLLRERDAFSQVVQAFAHVSEDFDLAAGVEARGFIFAAAVAALTGKGFVPIRKSGKLPSDTFSQSYDLEYGEASLHIHQDALGHGERVLLIDDVLATGGTLGAAAELIQKCGAVLDSVAVLIEIAGLNGHENFARVARETPITVLL